MVIIVLMKKAFHWIFWFYVQILTLRIQFWHFLKASILRWAHKAHCASCLSIHCIFIFIFVQTTFGWWKNGSYINDTEKHRWDNNCEDQHIDTVMQTLTIHNVQVNITCCKRCSIYYVLGNKAHFNF